MGQKYFLDLMEQRRTAPLLRPLLVLLSRGYALAVKMRHLGYQNRWFPTFSVQVPTVSIGNIVAGGTGKTPLVQMLAKELEAEGPIAILTRGFRSKAQNRAQPLCIDQQNLVSAEQCGDEPLLLAKTTRASVWVNRNRVLSAQKAKGKGAVCLILDDGFQHRRLQRDIDIVAIDASDPFSGHRFLPYGFLRDLPERLSQADLIVANHTQDISHYERVKKELSAYTQAPIVAMQHELYSTQSLKGKKVGAFCGIARPHYFFSALEQMGAEVVERCALLDHEGFAEQKLAAFIKACKAKGASEIVCTEKDWVKLVSDRSDALPIYPIGMRLKIIAGKEHWDKAVEAMKQKIRVLQ